MKIYLIGYMYSGKTTLGRQLAIQLGLPFYDTDQLLEARYHTTVPLLFAKYGEPAFRQLERAVLHSTADLPDAVIATGGGTPCHFDNMDFILSNGTVIYLEMSVEDVLLRESRSHKPRPLLVGLSPEEKRAKVETQLKERIPYYSRAHHTLSGMAPRLPEELYLG